MSNINAISSSLCPKVSFKQIPIYEEPAFLKDNPNDTTDFNLTNKVNTPKISKTRLFFSRLTDEQISAVNKAGKLPEGAKFCMNGFGGYEICNNFFNFRAGTQTIPAGFELKKDILGFTIVVPKDMKGAFIEK